MIVQNSWILYRTSKTLEDPYLDLIAFRQEIVHVYLAKHALSRNQSGRRRGRILPAKRRVNAEVRHDRFDHHQSRFVKQKRCGCCGKNTQKSCLKCGVRIHGYCFQEWHGIM